MAGQAPFDLSEAVSYITGLLPADLRDEGLSAARPADLPLRPSVGPLTAGLLQVLISAQRPARILELGTSLGYAAIAMGRAATTYGGMVTTVELDDRLANLARENVRIGGLEGTIQVVRGDARDYIASANGPFGLILQDSDKDLYLPMLPRIVELLEPGGLLISDDTLFPVADLPESAARWRTVMHEYNVALRDCPSLRTTWLPIGWGAAISVRTAPPVAAT
jgi:predicted O-methyltransferase YrrM